MKPTYINHVPVATGEVTVVLSDSAENIMRHSCATAKTVQSIGMGTLIINCGMSHQRFKEYSDAVVTENRAYTTDAQADIFMRSSVRGNLVGEDYLIYEVLRTANIGTLIIAGWEWTSSSWRRKERLLFLLRELMEDYNLTIIIYSQATTNPVAGKSDRGGIGKLALLAIGIVRLEVSEDLENVRPKVLPLCAKESEWDAAGRSAQLLINKIKGIRGEKGKEEDGGMKEGSTPNPLEKGA